MRNLFAVALFLLTAACQAPGNSEMMERVSTGSAPVVADASFPNPHNTMVVLPLANVPTEFASFSGAWSGRVHGRHVQGPWTMDVLLVVRTIDASGGIYYTYWSGPYSFGGKSGVTSKRAKIVGNQITLPTSWGGKLVFTLNGDAIHLTVKNAYGQEESGSAFLKKTNWVTFTP